MLFRHFTGAAVALALAAALQTAAAAEGGATRFAPLGTYASGSVALSSTPATVFPAATTARVRLVLKNTDYVTAAGTAAGIVAWCRYGTAATAPAAPHGLGSWPLFAGGGIDDSGPGVNQGAVNCMAESGAPLLYAGQY